MSSFYSWLIRLLKALQAWLASLSKKPVDLQIIVKECKMSNKKATGSPVKCPCLKQGKGAVMPAITITTVPSSITLQPVDASGNPVSVQPTDNVTGALFSDSASFAVTPGVDSLHYVATIPANTSVGTVVNLSATLTGTMGGNSVSFTASVQVTINISPPAPVAVDLDIILG